MGGTIRIVIAGVLLFALAADLHADIVEFRLTGNGGDGLLASNVTPPSGSSGSGNIGFSGITFDTGTSVMRVNVQWGSAFGYGDLTGDVTMLHLHGPTLDPPPDSFSQTGPLILNLALSASFVASGTGGGVNGLFLLNAADVPGLLGGRTYINVHTASFPTGEIRGYLVAVPEPGMASLSGLVAICAMIRRRR